MGSFLRSSTSDPVTAGINAFTSLNDSFDRSDNAKQVRQLNQMKIDEMQKDIKTKTEVKEGAEKIASLLEQEKQLNGMTEKFSNEFGIPKEKVVAVASKTSEALALSKAGNVNAITPAHTDAVMTLAAGTKQVPDKIENLDKFASSYAGINKFMKDIGPQLIQKPGQYKLSDKNFIDNLNTVEEENTNKGTNKFGLPASKKISHLLVDTTKNPPVYTKVLEVDSSLKDGQMFPRENKQTVYSADPDLGNISVIGNTDISKIPIRVNVDKDGNRSVSTVRSRSYNIDGKEVLLSTISPEGKLLNDEETMQQYKKTGKHLGMFNTIQDADAYADKLHNWKAEGEDYKKYLDRDPNDKYLAPETLVRSGGANDPIKQKPIMFDQARYAKSEEITNLMLKLRAKSDPAKFIEDYYSKILQRDINKEVKSVLQNIPEDLKGDKRSEWLMANKPEGIGWKEWHEITTPKGSITPLEERKLLQKDEDLKLKREIAGKKQGTADARTTIMEKKEKRLEKGKGGSGSGDKAKKAMDKAIMDINKDKNLTADQKSKAIDEVKKGKAAGEASVNAQLGAKKESDFDKTVNENFKNDPSYKKIKAGKEVKVTENGKVVVYKAINGADGKIKLKRKKEDDESSNSKGGLH